MPGLLDYIVQDYENGGYINPFDQSSSPTQSDVLDKYDIDLTDDKYAPFIPTYDQTGENFLRTNYIQDRQGLYGGARSALGQLGQKSRETSAQQGFAGGGKSLLDINRGDIVDQFGMDAQRLYTGLQQDIYGRRRGYDEDVLSAIADLPDDAYTMGENNNPGTSPDDFTSGLDVENAVSQALDNPPSGWTGGSNPSVGTTHTDAFGGQWQVVLNPPPASNPVWLLIDGG